MFINKCSSAALSFLIFIFLLGCSGENEAKQDHIDVRLKGQTGECLGQLGEDISSYFSAELDLAELEAVWSCVDGAVRDFQEITRPEHPEGYPPEALARFFEKFFVKREVPLSLAQALMNLKRIFVGGEKEFLTPAELEQLKVFLKTAKKWSVTIHPLISNLLLIHPEQVSSPEFQRSFEALTGVMVEFGDWLEHKDQVYTKTDMLELLLSLQGWLAPGPTTAILDTAIETLPLLFKVKALIVGGSDLEMRPNEWSPFMRKSSVVLSTLQRLGWKLNSSRIFSITLDKTLLHQLRDFEILFKDVQIPFAELKLVLNEVETLKWWPKDMEAKNLSESVYFVFSKILQIPGTPESMVLNENVLVALNKISNNFLSIWEFSNGGHKEFEKTLTRMGPVDINEKGLLVYSGQERIGVNARFQVGTLYGVIEILLDAYKLDSFSPESFNDIFAEILFELQRYGILSDIDPELSVRMFREINLFTFASNGDSNLDAAEVTQYAWMALSGMVQTQNFKDSLPGCEGSSECLFEIFQSNPSLHLENYPKLASFLRDLKPEDRTRFVVMASDVAGSKNLILNFVVYGYIEFFLMRFDSNQNSFIDLSESTSSYATFGPTFVELTSSVGLKEADSWALFTYLFKYGETPLSQFGGLLRFVHWKLHPDSWSYQADRFRMLQILAELKKL